MPYPQIHNATGGNLDAPTTDGTRDVCPVCQGLPHWLADAYGPSAGLWISCSHCKGTGMVPDRGTA